MHHYHYKKYFQGKQKSYFTGVIFLAIIFFGFFGLAKSSHAATINAASCSQADVQTAIDAAGDGDTVSIPSGNCIWTTGIILPARNLYIKGQGDTTIITFTNTTSYHLGMFAINTAGTPSFHISHMKIIKESKWPFISINIDDVRNFRVDHITYTAGSTANCGMFLWDAYTDATGVIDHNTITYNVGCTDVPFAIGAMGSYATGKMSWNRHIAWGTGDVVTIEDNTFNFGAKYDSALQSGGGSLVTFRHNTVYNTTVDVHGADSTSNGSGHVIEVYDNNYICNLVGGCAARQLSLRGGTAVFYNNTSTGWTNGLFLTYYRSCFNDFTGDADQCTAFGTPSSGIGNCNVTYSTAYLPARHSRCDGDQTIDKNTSGQYGWPCFQQPGTSGTGVGDITSADPTSAYQSDPIYLWNNTISTVGIDVGECDGMVGTPTEATHMQSGRDYIAADKTTFGYTPYTYPHPLTLSSDTTPPAAPSGLSVN